VVTRHHWHLGQFLQEREYFCALLEGPTRQLSGDEGMADDLPFEQPLDQSGVRDPQVIDSDRRLTRAPAGEVQSRFIYQRPPPA